MGNGTTHKYLMYFDSKFPYFHQNIITINLGKSYSVNEGVDVALTMTRAQILRKIGDYLPKRSGGIQCRRSAQRNVYERISGCKRCSFRSVHR